MTDAQNPGPPTDTTAGFWPRIVTAALQAAGLYLLVRAGTATPIDWPATEPRIFLPLFLVLILAPLVVQVGLGQMSRPALAIWVTLAGCAIAGLGYWDAARGRAALYQADDLFWPRFPLLLTVGAGLFVAHVLVVDSLAERRFSPSYGRHFDTAWKLAVQAVLALVFVGIFWGVLHLGAALFAMLGIDAVTRLIGERWFAIPATTLALAVSVQATDVQPALIRGARSVALTLFSWLLPLLALILLGFLATLAVVSLDPLWRTGNATALLLTAAAGLVLLINSAYQDGAGEATRSRVKRWTALLACLELLPLVALAGLALALRVGQHGWTTARILAAAAIVLAAHHAIGYVMAALASRSWLKRIEGVNFVGAYLGLALVAALFTPLADPARLMVANQMARLKSAAVTASEFDFAALKFDGARWGAAALAELATGTTGADAVAIAAGAKAALAATSRVVADRTGVAVPIEAAASRVTVYPVGRTLPGAFYQAAYAAFAEQSRPSCFERRADNCVARLIALTPGGAEAVLLVYGRAGSLFEQDGAGQWRHTAETAPDDSCGSLPEGIYRGDIGVAPHPWPDLMVGGDRLSLRPLRAGCNPD